MMDKWDKRFYEVAEQVASWSKDPTCKVGAVVVSPDRRQVSWGFNGFPKGIRDNDERLENKEIKNTLTIHAELNAILNAKTDLRGWTLYVTKPPCTSCALSIIQSGIARVVMPDIEVDRSWSKSQFRALNLMTAQAGMSFTYTSMED